MAKQQPAQTLTSEQVRQVKVLAGLGLTIESIAGVFDMSKKTLERRLKATPNAGDALLKGRAQAEAQIANMAFQMALSGKNPTMTIFWLKTRARWKEADNDLPHAINAPEAAAEKANVPKLIIDLSGKHVERKK